MAKRRKTHPGYTAGVAGKYGRRFAVHVSVRKTGERKPIAFQACANVRGGWGKVDRGTNGVVCAYGKNPRKAIAAALKKFSGSVGKRTGAFAGLGKK